MCGIVGILGIKTEVAWPAAERMRAAAAHRGPDDAGLAVIRGPERFAPAVLAHTRLSIVELSAAGHQPMQDAPSGTAPNALTFNGEIYNFRDLHPELKALGWPCRSGSDSEVILNAYRAWGVRAVERFEGMFAFALLDVERGLAVLARDRIGMKPLYVYRPARGGLLFASEVRTLLAAGGDLVPPRLNRRALESFLAQGAVASDHSIVEGVRMLAPGEALTLDFDGKPLRSARYWSVAFGGASGATTRPADGSDAEPASAGARTPAITSREALVAELSADLRRSLERLLLADVPVGLFLSSGIDSTALAVIAAEMSAQPLRTIAVGFDVASLDESEAAGVTARELGTQHQRVQLTGAAVLASFERVLSATDQPTVDGFNTFFTSRAAREAGLKVALSGVGGDELFGGYASFRDVPRALRLLEPTRRLSEGTRRRVGRLAERLGGAPLFGQRGRALAKVGEALTSPGDLVSLYLLRRELVAADVRRRLHPLPPGSDPSSGLELETLEALERETAATDPLDRIAALEFSMYMRHMLLRDADVFSMANAIELRLPLLEHYTVACAARARGAWRKPDPRPKPLLVDAVGSRLPERVWRRKKAGFTFPWQAWLSGPLRERAESALGSRVLAEAGLDPRAVSELGRRFHAGDRRVSALEVLALVVLESYLRENGLS